MAKTRKTVILGVTGGIAAFKSCSIVTYLKKRNINVIVVMTKNACEFVTQKTFETLSNNKVYLDTFDKDYEFNVEHVSLAHEADLFVVAPATANFIAKAADGIADDMLTTTYLAYKGKKVICPAMNTGMYVDEATVSNIELLKKRGVMFVDPTSGRLACGDEGMGKMAEAEVIGEFVINELRTKRDYEGKTVLVTCGGTVEDIDGVRCITNYSSGKMGVAIAENAAERGANVILVAARVSIDLPKDIETIRVVSTEDMYNAVIDNLERADVVIKAAAPCDFKVDKKFDNKIKDKNLTIEFVPTIDIAKEVGLIKKDKKLIIFAAETQNLIDNAKGKLIAKNADMVVANDLKGESSGFNKDTNSVTMIKKNGETIESGCKSKNEIAGLILDEINTL